MKKITCSIICLLLIIACNTDDNFESIKNQKRLTSIKYELKYRDEPSNKIYSQGYSFDKEGKVISEEYTNFLFPESSYYSTFEYDHRGRVIKEVRDGKAQFNIVWTINLAEVYNAQNEKIAEFTFDGERLTEYKTEFDSDNVRVRKLTYDSNQNIVSVKNETQTIVEYLEYRDTKLNPMHLIKSIGLLRIDYKPYFKNIFKIEKSYPFQGSDYSFPMTYFEYNYIFDSRNRVYQIEDEKSAIYKQEFTYN